jgi:hypothetical protein
MNLYLKRAGSTLAVALCAWVVGWGNSSSAQDESSVIVEQSADQPELVPALPTQPALLEGTAPGEELIAPEGAVTVHPVAKIDYDVTRRARRLFGGSPFVELAMVTQNPADGCFYEIPLCLPACCTGEPTVDSYCGLRGRGVVVYCYECGLEIEVKFRLRGDVEVEYGT